MAVAKWSTTVAATNIASTALNSLANGSTSSVMTYDNSTNRNLYARLTLDLGSITPATGGSVTLRYVGRYSGTAEDITSGLETYTLPLTTTTGAKKVIFEMVRLYPFADGFVIVNNSGVAFAATGNTLNLEAFSEDVT